MTFPAPRLRFRLLTLFIAISVLAVALAVVRRKWRRVAIHNELRRSFDLKLEDESSLPDAPEPPVRPPSIRRDIHYSIIELEESASVNVDSFELARHALTRADLLQRVTVVRLFSLPIDDEVLNALHELPTLRVLRVGIGSSDEQIKKCLQSLPRIVELSLINSQISDETGVELRAMPALEMVLLDRTDVAYRTCEQLGRLPQLKVVNLDGCQKLADEAIAQLAHSKSLEEIHLWDTACGDEGLMTLVQITTLKRVEIRDTNVTSLGVERFRLLRPDVKVGWENQREQVSTVTDSDSWKE